MFIIANATNENLTLDHLTLEVGMSEEVPSITKNMQLARNKGLITIAVVADLHPGSLLNNPYGDDITLVPENVDEALGSNPGSGTVTSVGLTMPNLFAVAGGPITGAGTFAVTFQSQLANKFLASPVGAPGVPVMRGIDPTDLPVATASAVGAVKQAAHQAQATGWTDATAMGNFNALLTALQNAGIMA